MKSHEFTLINQASIDPSSYLFSIWVDTLGFSKVAACMVTEAGTVSALDIAWSHDGSTVHGKEFNILAESSELNRTIQTETKARFISLIPKNRDASLAKNFTIYILLKEGR